MIQTIKVNFEVEGADEFQITKHINEFLRISYKEFAPSHAIVDYEVKDEGKQLNTCTRCRNNNL